MKTNFFGLMRSCPVLVLGVVAATIAGWPACSQSITPTTTGESVSGKPTTMPSTSQPVCDAKFFAENPPPGAIWMETLDLSTMVQTKGTPQVGKSFTGEPLSIKGTVFPHGIGTHANSEWVINLKGAAKRFSAVVGLDDASKVRGAVVFIVWVDGKEEWRSSLLQSGSAPEVATVDLTGARRMILMVEDGGKSSPWGTLNDYADWAGAMLMLVPGAAEQPSSEPVMSGAKPKIAQGVASEPAIHAPRITGTTPGRPFLFRIPATGQRPLRYSAQNLPAGLVLDAGTGIISGALAAEGETVVELVVEGPRGRASNRLTIVGGQHKLALTPPMGWNSWNVWGTSVDDAKVRAAADGLVNSGLADHGFQYVNIDDAWEGGRDANGRIQANEKFPDMKALADYVHSKGLKLGIYSSPGPQTCAKYEGSYEHEELDALQWAEWGIDLVKYDWCYYQKIAKDKSQAEAEKPYRIMRAALDKCNRDIVFSICQYGWAEVWKWGAAVGGNYWRTTDDITDSWSSMSGLGFGQNGLEPYAGPGHWNDPDMLVVGKVGWGPNLRDTQLTPTEQVTHITLWSLLAAPLLIGSDLTQMDEFVVALLTNPEVLEVNQDPLGRQARCVSQNGPLEVWSRLLADGTLAVGLFNRGIEEARVTATWKDLGVVGRQRVRNLWLRRDEGVFDDEYSSLIPRHGAVMLKIGSPR